MRYAAVVAALVGVSVAATSINTALATIDPCPMAPTPSPKVTVTEQFQTISLCVPTTTCSSSTCSTIYPLATTSVYVSTVIPCAVSGTSASTCTVTATDAVVPCSVSVSTITTSTPVPTTITVSGTTVTSTSWNTIYTTESWTWNAPYNMIGPLAIPGYPGSGQCSACAAGSDGSRSQVWQINDCIVSGGAQPSCKNYPYTYVSTVAPSSTAATSAVCSSQVAVSQAGVYTYTFPQVAPAATITVMGSQYTAPAQPWWAYVTQTAQGPTTFTFLVTVTQTITYYQPQPKTPSTTWGGWTNVAATTKSTSSQVWGDWSMWSTSKNPPAPTSTSQWSQWPTSTPVVPTTTSSWSQWTTTTSGAGSPTTLTTTVTTTMTTTIGTSSAPIPTQSLFDIQVSTGAGQRFRRRSDTKWVAFTGDDGEAVDDETSAALFFFDAQGNLKSGESFILNAGSGYITFEKVSAPASGAKFVGGKGVPIVLPGASFCIADGSLIISFGSKPSNCVPCSLTGHDSGSKSTTTTSGTATTSTKGTASTTTGKPTSTTTGKPTSTTTGKPTSTTTGKPTSTTTGKPTSTTTGKPTSTTKGSTTKPTSTTAAPTTTSKATTTKATTTKATTTKATTTKAPTSKPTGTTKAPPTSKPSKTADPSGDLDQPEPTAKAKAKKLIRGMRH